MKFWTVVRVIAGAFFIIIGVLLIILSLSLIGWGIDGDKRGIDLSPYVISFFFIVIGIFILFIPKSNKNSN